MKLTLTYGAAFELRIHTYTDENFIKEFGTGTLGDAVNYAEAIFADKTSIRADFVADILVIDTNTGEICAECKADPECGPTEVDFENENYDPDWGYNEDMGFDPYMGCYTDDC